MRCGGGALSSVEIIYRGQREREREIRMAFNPADKGLFRTIVDTRVYVLFCSIVVCQRKSASATAT